MAGEESHAAVNVATINGLERETHRAVVRTHNALVSVLEDAEDDVDWVLLDDGQVMTLTDALDQIEAVARALQDDERIMDDRLLAALPERDERVR